MSNEVAKTKYGTGEFKIVRAHEVERLTVEGWEIVDTYQDSDPVPMSVEIANPTATVRDWEAKTITTTSFAMGLVTLFVMRRSHDTAKEELRKQVEDLVGQTAELPKLQGAIKVAEGRVVEAKADTEEQRRLAAQHRDEAETYRASARKLEADLGKLR